MSNHAPVSGYGKVFEDMFTGSMYGQPAAVFVVWVYAITHMREKGQVCYVEINPNHLAPAVGLSAEEVTASLLYLQEPDHGSRSEEFEGRRLVCLLPEEKRHGGPMTYRVVNGFKYRMGTGEAERRAGNARRQRKAAAKKRAKKDSGGKWDEERWEQTWDSEGADAVLAVQRPMERGFDR